MTHATRTSLIQTSAWQDFVLAAKAARVHSERAHILEAAGLSVDLTGQARSAELDGAGQALLQARGFARQREQLFSGAAVNHTEGRAAWHTQLRAAAPCEEVVLERQRVNDFARRADSERRWRSIVHIGIGGSDWGVRLAVAAFGYTRRWREVRFASNIDGHAIEGALSGLNPRDTLIVLASKSFTTAETLQNGQRAIEWLRDAGVQDPYANVVAITARADLAAQWGVPPAHIFKLWEWVGGRFSLWSAIGLTASLAVGSDVVAGLQMGASAMDRHFALAPCALNAPVQMALAGVVNRSVLGYGSLNIAPYDFRLTHLVPYLQQLEMESLGKSVGEDGQPVEVPTGPAVWGMPGTDAQHTFFQWLHQGSDGAPVDFIVCQNADHRWDEHHLSLLANCLAQREALLHGKDFATALNECLQAGVPPEQVEAQARHRVHQGGRPSTLIVLPQLSPYSLGALLALYEHKVFTQGVIWGINPFDQWGVEYGKALARGIAAELRGQPAPPGTRHDASTAHWVKVLR
jgi:glucose-6-phosphate isomerase